MLVAFWRSRYRGRWLLCETVKEMGPLAALCRRCGGAEARSLARRFGGRLVASDEDESSNSSALSSNFYFNGLSIDDATCFFETHKSNGENAKFSMQVRNGRGRDAAVHATVAARQEGPQCV